jgi:hypothetical protein
MRRIKKQVNLNANARKKMCYLIVVGLCFQDKSQIEHLKQSKDASPLSIVDKNLLRKKIMSEIGKEKLEEIVILNLFCHCYVKK